MWIAVTVDSLPLGWLFTWAVTPTWTHHCLRTSPWLGYCFVDTIVQPWAKRWEVLRPQQKPQSLFQQNLLCPSCKLLCSLSHWTSAPTHLNFFHTGVSRHGHSIPINYFYDIIAQIYLAPRWLQEIGADNAGISDIHFTNVPVIFIVSYPETKLLRAA